MSSVISSLHFSLFCNSYVLIFPRFFWYAFIIYKDCYFILSLFFLVIILFGIWSQHFSILCRINFLKIRSQGSSGWSFCLHRAPSFVVSMKFAETQQLLARLSGSTVTPHFYLEFIFPLFLFPLSCSTLISPPAFFSEYPLALSLAFFS